MLEFVLLIIPTNLCTTVDGLWSIFHSCSAVLASHTMKEDKMAWSEMDSYPVPSNGTCPAEISLSLGQGQLFPSPFAQWVPVPLTEEERGVSDPWFAHLQHIQGAHAFSTADIWCSCPPWSLLSPRVALWSVQRLLRQLQQFSGLLWGVAGPIHSFKDWGTLNGGKITGRVWIKTAFKPLTFLSPWLLLIASESFQLVEGENVKIFLCVFARCPAVLGVG